jgi:acetyl esterase/lipase
MPSIAARIVNRIIRLAVKSQPLHEMSVDDVRHFFEARRGPIDVRGVSVEPVWKDGVVGEWARPVAGAARTILYLHGGGYVFGSPRLYRGATAALARAAEANVFSLSYRLAPESRCPAAIEDALAAIAWLTQDGVAPPTLAIGGDSAGGGLALATLQALRDRGRAHPACAVLFSPWTDLAATGASVSANARSDCLFQEASIRQSGARYAGALDLKDPRVSPLYGEFRGLPPMMVFASRAEMLYDDSVRLVERARASGVETRFEARDGLVHIWPLMHNMMPEGRADLNLAAEFIRARTGGEARSAA